MKIVEKKCPNCHANLEFRVGEEDVECPSCRRKYAIEYDKDVVDPEVKLKMKDIQLKLLDTFQKDYERSRKFSSIFVVIFAVIFVAIFAFIIYNGIRIYQDSESTRTEFERSREEQLKEQEENAQKQKEVMDEIENRIKESEGEQ